MMANTNTTIKITKLPATMNVKVVVTRQLRIRLWIAKQLILFAAWILQVPIEATFNEDLS